MQTPFNLSNWPCGSRLLFKKPLYFIAKYIYFELMVSLVQLGTKKQNVSFLYHYLIHVSNLMSLMQY